MDFILLMVALVIVAMVVLFAIGSLAGSAEPPLIAKPLMTRREREALMVLEEIFPSYRIHSQVAMGAVIKTKPGLDKKTRYSWRNRFDRKIIDFVIELKATGEIIALVELDDKTHEGKQAEKDRKRDAMTSAAGYSTVRIPPRAKLRRENLEPLFVNFLPGTSAQSSSTIR